MIYSKSSFFVFILSVLLLSSCKKDNAIDNSPETPNKPLYSIPTTYNFSSVDYSGQTTRLDMLTEMVTYMKTGNTMNTVLSETKLLNMYDNVGNEFTNPALNTSLKKLKDKTFSTEVASFESFMDSIEVASQSTVAGSNGQAGVINSGASNYLCSKYGVEYTQMIEKGMIGAVCYYQIVAIYLGSDKVGLQVSKADRQHHWDEAFGYFGVPIDFPSNKTGARFLGKYSNERDLILGSNTKIMKAFLTGRAAINNNDLLTMNEQIVILRNELEKMIAATAISYLNKAKVSIADNAIRNHALSEGVGFIKALTYSPTKKISTTQISDALNKLKSNDRYDFYSVSDLEMEEIKTIISNVYGFNSIKNSL